MNDPVYSIHRSAPAGGSPTPEQAALLRERFDGQVKTLRALGEETDVHWTIWRRWALELRLKNPADQQPRRETMRRTKSTIAAVPDEPEAIEEHEEEHEDVADEPESDGGEVYPTCPTCGYVMSECECDTDDRETETEPVSIQAPTPVVAMPSAPVARPRSLTKTPSLRWDDQRFLEQYLSRLPAAWTAEERERWLRAFVATVDMLVPIESRAGSTAAGQEGVS